MFEKFYMVVTANRKLRWAHALGTVVVVGQGYVCMIHVGGTRCVPSSTDHNMNIQDHVDCGMYPNMSFFCI